MLDVKFCETNKLIDDLKRLPLAPSISVSPSFSSSASSSTSSSDKWRLKQISPLDCLKLPACGRTTIKTVKSLPCNQPRLLVNPLFCRFSDHRPNDRFASYCTKSGLSIDDDDGDDDEDVQHPHIECRSCHHLAVYCDDKSSVTNDNHRRYETDRNFRQAYPDEDHTQKCTLPNDSLKVLSVVTTKTLKNNVYSRQPLRRCVLPLKRP